MVVLVKRKGRAFFCKKDGLFVIPKGGVLGLLGELFGKSFDFFQAFGDACIDNRGCLVAGLGDHVSKLAHVVQGLFESGGVKFCLLGCGIGRIAGFVKVGEVLGCFVQGFLKDLGLTAGDLLDAFKRLPG
jgi:hypothetical protein